MKNNSRRKFIMNSLTGGIAVGALSTMPNSLLAMEFNQANPFSQTPLPYGYGALEPLIDAMTMEIHYTKHAATYTKNLNEAALSEFKGASISLEDALKNISTYSPKMRNNGGGHFNHELFWKTMISMIAHACRGIAQHGHKADAIAGLRSSGRGQPC